MKNSLNTRLGILLFIVIFPLRGIADDEASLPTPPIPGWGSLHWGMTQDQLQKATGSKLTLLSGSNLYKTGNVSFYGYDETNVQIRFDDKKGLREIRFIIWNVEKANVAGEMKQLHGKLEALLGAPSADDMDKKDPNGFKTMWCAPEWSVFLDTVPLYKAKEISTGISVSYSRENTCK